MACFADINVSQVSQHMQGAMALLNTHLTANLPRKLPVKIVNRLRFDRVMVVSLWPHFWLTLYIVAFRSDGMLPFLYKINSLRQKVESSRGCADHFCTKNSTYN